MKLLKPTKTWIKVQRFWSQKDILPNECWEYTGDIGNHGYGRISIDGTRWLAHRLAFFLSNGYLSNSLLVCHTCDYTKCINPKHLYIGTHDDNMKDVSNRNRWNNRKGSKNPNSSLSEEQIIEIRSKYTGAYGEKTKLSKEYGVGLTTIREILNRETWNA